MKRFFSLFLCLVLALGWMGAVPAAAKEVPTLKVVTTIFPIYDWVSQLLGADAVHAELTILLDSGVDLHSYQPTVDDIIKISTCDLFIYVGGESDKWVDDALRESVNPDMVVIDLLDILGDAAKEEEIIEGMEAEDEHDHEGHDHEEGPEYDEHVWLSLKNARVCCAAIADGLQQIDPENAETYAANLSAYDEDLAALDAKYSGMTADAAFTTVLFGDRFPFRYLVDDYGLDYYAAFQGCSAETEASFETIVFLAAKVDELSLPAILTIEGQDHRIAQTIAENTQSPDLPILTMDSMQSVTAADAEAGTTYLGIMEDNLAVLDQALNG